jgi:uncharacterized protein (DUF4415 family)
MDSGVYIMMPDMKYLILSTENFCVYTMSPRHLTANALVAGEGDSMIRGITWSNSVEYNRVTNRDFFYDKIYTVDTARNAFIEVDPANVSDTWKQTREILRLRQDAFFNWETHLSNSLARVMRHGWEHFDVVAEQEIAKSDPANNSYTWVLEEYARTMEVSVQQAYKELKLRIESDNITKFRIQALGEKWRNKINQCNTFNDIEAARKEMVREFWLNSLI